jgi:hypothetical protein
MTKWAVYSDNTDLEFFATESEARNRVQELIKQCYESADYESVWSWDITLLEVKGEVQETPDGLKLQEIK